MSNPRVEVRMGPDFYKALCAFAAEQEVSPAVLVLHAAKAYLSQHKRWATGMRGRALRTRGKPILEEVKTC